MAALIKAIVKICRRLIRDAGCDPKPPPDIDDVIDVFGGAYHDWLCRLGFRDDHIEVIPDVQDHYETKIYYAEPNMFELLQAKLKDYERQANHDSYENHYAQYDHCRP